MPGIFREPRDVRQDETTRRELDKLFRLYKQQSTIVAQIVQTDTGEVVTPVEVPATPEGGENAEGVSEENPGQVTNPDDPEGKAPEPKEQPKGQTLSGTNAGFTLSAGNQYAHVLIPKPMKILSAVVSYSEGANDYKFTSTSANYYKVQLWSASKKKQFDRGSLSTLYYPVFAQGSHQFPGQFIDGGEVDAFDQLYVSLVAVGSPSNVSSRNITLTIYAEERIPKL